MPDKMPKRNPRLAKATNTHPPTTPLRRSPRLNPPQCQGCTTDKPRPRNKTVRSPDSRTSFTRDSSVRKTHGDCQQRRQSDSSKSKDGSGDRLILTTGLRRSPRLSLGAGGFSSLRRSPRFSNQPKSCEFVDTNRNFTSKQVSDSKKSKKIFKCVLDKSMDSGVAADGVTGRVDGDVLGKNGRVCVVGLMANRSEKGTDICERNGDVGLSMKRKRGEEGNGTSQGWTKEQESALQTAYFLAKPTPHFWKKVSRLVPGKSAQDCFDKVHSDHITPPQPLPRSRANKMNSSSIGKFALSASKLINLNRQKIRKPGCNKQKNRLVQKTVRQLLQKHSQVSEDNGADLFSVLEPNMTSSAQSLQLNAILSTPKRFIGQEEFLQKCNEGSTSDQKKPLSRLSNVCRVDLVSPPVLKQVKNKAVHEKYIDQLHRREAKRKAASGFPKYRLSAKENRRGVNVQKTDIIKAAKDALATEARDVVNQLHQQQDNALSDCSNFDDDGFDSNGDEDETEL
ncbi:hypothetical protein HS088_TW03G00038 [Tripterygium wilfordii]|uniref:Homeodomain-like superfamily protein n=1 Tax=Tripterygium wilfordii TaxID=458696 RepID=A0A7J7DTT8_TRIWF|nr:uncharacterized protein LOC119989765 [Tripterygium wilfordii]KAF5749713.1 hypothetical protein HS088_TW03G00038 [Tripterygium wilfordii]